MSVRDVRKYLPLTVIGCLLLATVALQAQNNNNETYGTSREDKGATASILTSGSSSVLDGIATFDGNIGYNFTHHFGIDVGVPYSLLTRPGFFTGTSDRPGYANFPYIGCTYFFGCFYAIGTTPRLWTGELGDVYAEMHYTRTYRRYDFLTNLTGDAPTASYRKGLTTGRAQWDWFNHIDTDIHGFTPFVNAGLANGRMDQHFLPRPFQTDLPFRTLGYMADFEGGIQYKVWRRFNIGFSVWDVLPFGPQKIYSELVWRNNGPDMNNILDINGSNTGIFGPRGTGIGTGTGTGTGLVTASAKQTTVNFNSTPGVFGYLVGDPNHGRYWNTYAETVGPNWIDRDNGYSATLGVSPSRFFDILVAYNHSARYALDTVQLTLEFNANAVFRKLTNY